MLKEADAVIENLKFKLGEKDQEVVNSRVHIGGLNVENNNLRRLIK